MKDQGADLLIHSIANLRRNLAYVWDSYGRTSRRAMLWKRSAKKMRRVAVEMARRLSEATRPAESEGGYVVTEDAQMALLQAEVAAAGWRNEKTVAEYEKKIDLLIARIARCGAICPDDRECPDDTCEACWHDWLDEQMEATNV